MRDDIGEVAGEPMSESATPGSFQGQRRSRTISTPRRRELLDFAVTLAGMVETRTEVHERCLLRYMVEMLVQT